MDVRVGLKKAERWGIDAFELWCWRRLLRVLWTAKRSNQSILKEISPDVHWKDWCWSWSSNTLATWCEELTHLKRPSCWERLRAAGEGDDRGWDGWMASPTRWTWVWVDSGNWWWTGRPSVLWFMGLQRVGHDWATELNWRYSSLWHSGFSLWWLSLWQSVGSRVCRLQYLQLMGSVVAAWDLEHGLSCSIASGIFPDQICVSHIGRWIPDHWTTKKSGILIFYVCKKTNIK